MAHLDSCRADRLWAYKNLTKYWDKSFEPKVKDVWEKLHEPICSWAIIRNFPISYIKENLKSFTGERDFYFVSRRFAEDPNYVIERDKLSSINYLSVIYHSGRTVSDEEAEDILYKIVREMCIKGFGFEDLENVDFPDGIISPNNLRSIRLGKYYLREMGFINTVISFDNWNQKVLHNIFQSSEFEEIIKEMIKLLTSNESKRYESHELITSKITHFSAPSDPQYLEELKHYNPIVSCLLDKLSLELEI